MAWRIETDPRAEYLAIRILGDAGARAADEVAAAILREIAAHPCSRVLVDIREVEGRLSVLDTFDVVSNYHSSARGIRAAIIDLPENRSWFEFYETVSTNRGYHHKVFIDPEEAIRWLIT